MTVNNQRPASLCSRWKREMENMMAYNNFRGTYPHGEDVVVNDNLVSAKKLAGWTQGITANGIAATFSPDRPLNEGERKGEKVGKVWVKPIGYKADWLSVYRPERG